MTSDEMIYIPSFMKIGSGIQVNIMVIASTIWNVVMLVLLMTEIS
jgi:hypothetical protein